MVRDYEVVFLFFRKDVVKDVLFCDSILHLFHLICEEGNLIDCCGMHMKNDENKSDARNGSTLAKVKRKNGGRSSGIP